MRRFIAVGLLFGVVFAGCDDPVRPGSHEELVLEEGINVFLVVSDEHASTGRIIAIDACIRVVGEAMTPTGFLADFHFDRDRLEPVEVREQPDGVLRAVNLDAGTGLVKAAGAAPDGLGTEVLFSLRVRVKRADYMASLSISLEELIVLEHDFANVAADVGVLQDAVPARVTVLVG